MDRACGTYARHRIDRKTEGKEPLGRPSCRRDNITMDIREVVLEVLDWMHLARERHLWFVFLKSHGIS
jgi:hypothetical protein